MKFDRSERLTTNEEIPGQIRLQGLRWCTIAHLPGAEGTNTIVLRGVFPNNEAVPEGWITETTIQDGQVLDTEGSMVHVCDPTASNNLVGNSLPYPLDPMPVLIRFKFTNTNRD